MNARTVRLVRASFFFLALGIGLGVIFALDRSIGVVWRPLHAEANLWGAVTLLIYGMAYHMLPRFTGRPLPSEALAEVQSWAAIAGVALAVAGWCARLHPLSWSAPLLLAGGALQFSGALLFVYLAGHLLFKRTHAYG